MDVIAEITKAAGDGSHGFARRDRTGTFRTIRMPVFDRFVATRSEAIPTAYLIPPGWPGVIDLLHRHGVAVESLTAPWAGKVEAFRVDSLRSARRQFEGHRAAIVEGSWVERDGSAAAGWFRVSTDQPRGVLAAYLLEPASEDGLVTWNLFDRALQQGGEAPVLRVRLRNTTEPRR
jgi:hypothetical protein